MVLITNCIWSVSSTCWFAFSGSSLRWAGGGEGRSFTGKAKRCQHLTIPLKKATVFVDFTVAHSTYQWRPGSSNQGGPEAWRKAKSKNKGDIDDEMHGDSQSRQEFGGRASADQEDQGNLCGDGEVQRGVG